jgi:enoyl-CoA hydratase/carnithine racemase
MNTITIHSDGPVRVAEINAPPMNLLGPELVRDLVALIRDAEEDGTKVVVFKSGNPNYFVAHVDLGKVAEYRAEAVALTGEASIASLFRYLSASRLVTIAQIEGRVRGAGSEFVLACDIRFAARGRAILGQFEPAFGQVPGGGAIQYLTRLLGRGRALEVLLSARDYDADLAERYGWVNRALPADELGEFVRELAQRIGRFPATGLADVKERVDAISLASLDEFRRDSDLFVARVSSGETQALIRAATARGFQTRDGELDLGEVVGDLDQS